VRFGEIFDNLDYGLIFECEARKGRIGICVNQDLR
jgi:hypothetical protein